MPKIDLPPPPDRPLTADELAAVALGKGPDHPGLRWLYLGLEGRIPRRTFWLHGVLALLVVGFAGNAVFDIAGITTDNTDRLVNLLLAWPLIAISAKRLHDFNCSAWWMLVNLVPVIGSIATLLVNGLMPGTPGPNRYGPDPLRRPPVAH
jgi:uncharacterized membrane protein YhaH (DUF805 family)